MQYDIPSDQLKQAKQPHELFLINLIFNHILVFIAALSIVDSIPYFIFIVPLTSVSILSYTLWRANKSLTCDPWYVKCHWHICTRRSKVFLSVIFFLMFVMLLGWVGYTYYEMERVQTLALIGGIVMLPTMGTILVLIILESDALHQSRNGSLPPWVVEKFPTNKAVKMNNENNE